MAQEEVSRLLGIIWVFLPNILPFFPSQKALQHIKITCTRSASQRMGLLWMLISLKHALVSNKSAAVWCHNSPLFIFNTCMFNFALFVCKSSKNNYVRWMPDGEPRTITEFFLLKLTLFLKDHKHRCQINSRKRCCRGLLITRKKLIWQLYVLQAASPLAANPSKQQMSRASGFAVNSGLWGKIQYLLKKGKKGHNPDFYCILRLFSTNE